MRAGRPTRNAPHRSALSLAFLIIFLDILGLGLLLPVLPLLVLAGPDRVIPDGWSTGDGFILLGLLAAAYPMLQFFSSPILGQLSDRFGRKPVLAVSLAGTAVGYALFAYAIVTKNIPLLFLSRMIDGVSAGNISVAQAVIADVSPAEQRTRNFGFIGAAFGLGFIIGPFIGSKLASPGLDIFGLFTTPAWFGAATVFGAAALLAVLNLTVLIYKLPETHVKKHRVHTDITRPFHNIRLAASLPGLNVLFPVLFLYFAGFTLFTTFFQLNLAERLDFSPSSVGNYFAFLGLSVVLTQLLVTPRIARRVSNSSVLRWALPGAGVGLLALILTDDVRLVLLFTPLFAVLNGLARANGTALVSSLAGAKAQGRVLGINSSVQALAQAIPLAVGGFLAAIAVTLPIFVAAGCMMLAGVVFVSWFHAPKPTYE